MMISICIDTCCMVLHGVRTESTPTPWEGLQPQSVQGGGVSFFSRFAFVTLDFAIVAFVAWAF